MPDPAQNAIDMLYQAVTHGERPAARQLTERAVQISGSAEEVLDRLVWPTLDAVQRSHRDDELNRLSHQYATRLLRQLVDQLQPLLPVSILAGPITLVVAGNEQAEELAAQICADLLESRGYQVYYCGGGVANDEVVAEIGHRRVERLVIFGAVPETVPATRLLIDHLHETGLSPRVQIVVGGGVFNRAEGLAEEIGADLWAASPLAVVELMEEMPQRRMDESQRTVGRSRQINRRSRAA